VAGAAARSRASLLLPRGGVLPAVVRAAVGGCRPCVAAWLLRALLAS